jgi:hypothetical protein
MQVRMFAEPGDVVAESRSANPLTLSLLTGEAIIRGLILTICWLRALGDIRDHQSQVSLTL